MLIFEKVRQFPSVKQTFNSLFFSNCNIVKKLVEVSKVLSRVGEGLGNRAGVTLLHSLRQSVTLQNEKSFLFDKEIYHFVNK